MTRPFDLVTAADDCGQMLRWTFVDERWHLVDEWHVDPGKVVTTDAIPAHATFCPRCRAAADGRLGEVAA